MRRLPVGTDVTADNVSRRSVEGGRNCVGGGTWVSARWWWMEAGGTRRPLIAAAHPHWELACGSWVILFRFESNRSRGSTSAETYRHPSSHFSFVCCIPLSPFLSPFCPILPCHDGQRWSWVGSLFNCNRVTVARTLPQTWTARRQPG